MQAEKVESASLLNICSHFQFFFFHRFFRQKTILLYCYHALVIFVSGVNVSTLCICYQVLKEVSLGIGSTLCGVSSSSMGSKEIHYVMRQLGPAMCRNSDLLKSLAQNNLKISLQNGKGKSYSSNKFQ